MFQLPLQLDWGHLMKLWSVGDEQTRGYMHVFLISPPSFSSSLTQRAAGNKRGRLTEFFWSQQWNICFNSFILGLQVGMLNRIQSNVVGKPICVCVCVCVCARSVAQLCPTLCNPLGSAYQGPLARAFSRHKCWSGLPFCPGTEAVSLRLLCRQVASLWLSCLRS